MSLRRCAALRDNAVVHLFIEGTETTLCGRYMGEDYLVRPSDEIPSCHRCVQQRTRDLKAAQQEEQAS